MRRKIFISLTAVSVLLVLALEFYNHPEVFGGENQTPWDVGARVYVSYELSDVLEGKRSSTDIPKCEPTVASAFPGEAAVLTAVNGELVNVRLGSGVELVECHHRWFSRDSRGFTQLTVLNETSYELGQEVYLTYELAEKLDSPKAHGIRLQVVTINGDRVSVRFDNDGVVLHDLEWQLLTKDAPYELPSFWWSDPTL